MANNYLITGYWGEPHVTPENDRCINAAAFGKGRFVLPIGERFRAEYMGNNIVRVHDGLLLDNGAAAGIPVGEYVDLQIANAGQGMNRNDLIVFRYTLDTSTLVERGTFLVVKGTETSGTASDPPLTKKDLLAGGATSDNVALWRVRVSGAVISDPERVYDVNSPFNYKRQITSYDNMDDIKEDGIYYFSSTSLPVNAPFTTAAVVLVFGDRSLTTTKIQLAFCHGTVGRGKFRGLSQSGWRPWSDFGALSEGDNPGCYYRNMNDGIEWVSPAMVSGVEYRTAERHNGKIVYACRLNVGALPDHSEMTVTVPSGVSEIISLSGIISSGTTSAMFPVVTVSGTIGARIRKLGERTIQISTFENLTAYSATVDVKYTKS